MTGIELTSFIGRIGLMVSGGLKVPIRVVDAKRAWGNLRYRVTPLLPEGWPETVWTPEILGKEWVGSERVTLEDKTS